MRPGPVAYTWGRPTPNLRKAPNPLTAYLSAQLLPLRALRELYAPGSLGACLQFIHVRLTFWGEEGSLTGSPNSTRNSSSGPAGVLINRILPFSFPVLVKACTVVLGT